MKHSVIISILILALFIDVATSQAWSRFSVSSNGESSRSHIESKKYNRLRLGQSNTTFNNSTISVTTNTGGNQTVENTGTSSTSIQTGNTTQLISIFNSGGFNFSDRWNCWYGCDQPDSGPSPTPTPEPTPSPMPPACAEEIGWVTSTISADQGTRKDGQAITSPDRIDEKEILGPVDGRFFSLGKNGQATVAFSQPVQNTAGADLVFYEVTNDRGVYPEEKIEVEVSQDGSTWFAAGEVTNNDNGTGVGQVDFNITGLSTVTYLRLSDTTDFSLHLPEADGYDIDAVEAVVQVCEAD